MVVPTFCRSPGRVPFGSYSATQRVALLRGAAGAGPSERHAVGCCGRVGRPSPLDSSKLPRTRHSPTATGHAACSYVHWRFVGLSDSRRWCHAKRAKRNIGRATLWQKRRASGRLRRSRLRCSCDAANAQRVQFELLLPCTPGALSEAADSRESLQGTLNTPGDSRSKVHSVA